MNPFAVMTCHDETSTPLTAAAHGAVVVASGVPAVSGGATAGDPPDPEWVAEEHAEITVRVAIVSAVVRQGAFTTPPRKSEHPG